MRWQKFADENPELAAFGAGRFASGVAYLATIRGDGGPRVHPVTPILGAGRVFVFMEPSSPKGRDLERDGRYMLHAAVEDPSGGQGEFYVRGRARRVDDARTRSLAAEAASYSPAERYILFELEVDEAFSTVYAEDGVPLRRRWDTDAVK